MQKPVYPKLAEEGSTCRKNAFFWSTFSKKKPKNDLFRDFQKPLFRNCACGAENVAKIGSI